MGKSIMVEVNEYIQSQIKRELTGKDEMILTDISELKKLFFNYS